MLNKPSQSFDCIVLGGGVLGASIFFHLAQAGYRVALLEQNNIASGCTAWSGGIVRCYHSQTRLSDKAVYSWQYYKNFHQHTGQHGEFNTTGFLYFPDKDHRDSAKLETKRLAQYLPIEWLEPNQLQEQFGDWLQPDDVGAIYEPESGYMDPVATTQAWVRAGIAHGGKVYEQVSIQSWQFPEQGGAVIHSSHETFLTNHLIFAAGASTPFLLSQLGFDHDMYAQMIQVDIRKPSINTDAQPAFIDDQFNLNGRPNPEEGTVYIGHPTYLRINHPTELCEWDPTHSALIEQTGRKRWRWTEQSAFVRSLRAPDCYTEDGSGRVQALPGQKGLYVASGFSGGGFKMAPWVGNHILELVSKNSEVIQYV
jgi:glycine/D-amino acid oxidase-like deaminating enzyme